jgi:hypothetical protein
MCRIHRPVVPEARGDGRPNWRSERWRFINYICSAKFSRLLRQMAQEASRKQSFYVAVCAPLTQSRLGRNPVANREKNRKARQHAVSRQDTHSRLPAFDRQIRRSAQYRFNALTIARRDAVTISGLIPKPVNRRPLSTRSLGHYEAACASEPAASIACRVSSPSPTRPSVPDARIKRPRTRLIGPLPDPGQDLFSPRRGRTDMRCAFMVDLGAAHPARCDGLNRGRSGPTAPVVPDTRRKRSARGQLPTIPGRFSSVTFCTTR